MRVCVEAPPGECLRVKADMVLLQVTLWDPYLSALEAFAKTCYTNRRYLYLLVIHVFFTIETGDGRFQAVTNIFDKYFAILNSQKIYSCMSFAQ